MGRVLSATGLNCLVSDAAAGGRVYECTVRRVVRTMSRDQRGAVVAGDSVLFQPIDREHGVIERINPRRSVLNRGTKGKEQVIAANITQALILASAANPGLKTNLIDRLLISATKEAPGRSSASTSATWSTPSGSNRSSGPMPDWATRLC